MFLRRCKDVLAIAVNVGEVATVRSKQMKELKKRDITLLDQSGHTIEFTLWGPKAENLGMFSLSEKFTGSEFNPAEYPVLAIKSAKVCTFNSTRICFKISYFSDRT